MLATTVVVGACFVPGAVLLSQGSEGARLIQGYLREVDCQELLVESQRLMSTCPERVLRVHWNEARRAPDPSSDHFLEGAERRPFAELAAVVRRPGPVHVRVTRDEVRLVWDGHDLGHGVVIVAARSSNARLNGPTSNHWNIAPGVYGFTWHAW